MPHDATLPYEEDPNHMIIWLDHDIGNPNECQHLKAAFSSTADPKNETPIKLLDKDYDEILRAEGPLPVNFEGVRFLLAAFTDVQRCIQCFERNQDKRIFFITSGSLGREAIPIILARFKKIFTDPITYEPYMSIYVFCLHIKYHIDWASHYNDYIQMFTHQADLLARMIRDIADNFVIEGRRLIDEDPPNNPAAHHFLSWAHELYQRYSKLESDPMKKELKEVNELLENVEEELKSSSDEED